MIFKGVLLLSVFVACSRAYSLNGLCLALGDGGLIPDPVDCSKYYECANLRVVQMSCTDGLYFNRKSNVCDYPQNTKCNPQSDPIIDDGSTTDLCKAQKTGSLIRNNLDCRMFYECTSEGPVSFTCPTGTYYNAAKHACDYAENTICLRDAVVEQN